MHLHGMADHLRELSDQPDLPTHVGVNILVRRMDDGHLALCDVCGEACSPHDATTCEEHHLCSQHESCLDCRECIRAAEAARQDRLAETDADEWRHRAMGRH